MKSFITGAIAAITGAITLIILFFRKGGANIPLSTPEMKKADDKVKELKTAIQILEEKKNSQVEDKGLQEEIDYWNKEKK
jgi:hypothetical protein